MEEQVLPSFAWQRYPHLVARSRPPLVARTLVSVNGARDAGLSSLAAHVRGADHWCGVKIAHDSASEKDLEKKSATHMLLESVAREVGGIVSTT